MKRKKTFFFFPQRINAVLHAMPFPSTVNSIVMKYVTSTRGRATRRTGSWWRLFERTCVYVCTVYRNYSLQLNAPTVFPSPSVTVTRLHKSKRCQGTGGKWRPSWKARVTVPAQLAAANIFWREPRIFELAGTATSQEWNNKRERLQN